MSPALNPSMWNVQGEQQMPLGVGKELRRVKIYRIFNYDEWIDNGVGFYSHIINEDPPEELFIVRSDVNLSEVIFSTVIRWNTVYQSWDNIIKWEEPDGSKYALDFQYPEGAREVLGYILRVGMLSGTASTRS